MSRIDSALTHGASYKVYLMFAQDTSGAVFVKIGISHKVESRYFHVQTGCPHRIETVKHVLIGFKYDAQKAEKALHKAMKAHNTVGEWFKIASQEAKDCLNAALKNVIPQFAGPSHNWVTVKEQQLRLIEFELSKDRRLLKKTSLRQSISLDVATKAARMEKLRNPAQKGYQRGIVGN